MATKKTTESAEKKTTTRTTKARTKKPVAVEATAATPAPEKRTPSYEEVAQLAQRFWIERGSPFGSPEIDWLRAEAALQA